MVFLLFFHAAAFCVEVGNGGKHCFLQLNVPSLANAHILLQSLLSHFYSVNPRYKQELLTYLCLPQFVFTDQMAHFIRGTPTILFKTDVFDPLFTEGNEISIAAPGYICGILQWQ